MGWRRYHQGMFSYRHAFHAGNHADVIKHLTLIATLQHLQQKEGGITATNFRDMQSKHPGRALEKAVKGMLPKGPLGYAMIKKLKVYGGAEHPHTAQQPKVLDI